MPSVPGMGRRAVKKDDVRLAHAHLTRVLADSLPPGTLADNVIVRDKLIEFVRETARHITTTAGRQPAGQPGRHPKGGVCGRHHRQARRLCCCYLRLWGSCVGAEPNVLCWRAALPPCSTLRSKVPAPFRFAAEFSHLHQRAAAQPPADPIGRHRCRYGSALVARCYWDFGRWSDLWRAWRPLPDSGASLEECLLRIRTQEDATRWARVLCELLREVWARAERSAWVTHLELVAKLQVGGGRLAAFSFAGCCEGWGGGGGVAWCYSFYVCCSWWWVGRRTEGQWNAVTGKPQVVKHSRQRAGRLSLTLAWRWAPPSTATPAGPAVPGLRRPPGAPG
jgi:hypothetical protein